MKRVLLILALALATLVPAARADVSSRSLAPDVQRAVDAVAHQPIDVDCGALPAGYETMTGYAYDGPSTARFAVQLRVCYWANALTTRTARRMLASRAGIGYRYSAAESLLALAHEALHTRAGRVDWRDEAATECAALDEVRGLARRLGVSPRLSNRLAVEARDVVHPSIVAGHPAYAC